MHIAARLLTLGPDDMGQRIVQGVIGGIAGHQLLAEYYGGHAILLETCAQGQIRFAAVELIAARRRTIPSIIITHTAGQATRRTDDDIRAVHGIEVVARCVRIKLVLGLYENTNARVSVILD